MIISKIDIRCLETVRHPDQENLVEAGMVEDNIRIEGMKVSFP